MRLTESIHFLRGNLLFMWCMLSSVRLFATPWTVAHPGSSGPWDFLGRIIKWQPTPVFLPGESHGWRSMVGYSPWGRKESDTSFTHTKPDFPCALGFPCGPAGKESTCNVGDLGLIPGWGRSSREGKATHSSILA